MQTALAEILQHPAIRRGNGFALASSPTIPSGFAGLDAALPGGGWPLGGVSECLVTVAGCGELRLLLPTLERVSRARQVVLIAPPYVPYAPAWQAAGVDLSHLTWIQPHNQQDVLWATEQALREPACGAVVCWLDQPLADRSCRRFLLAAESGGGLGFVMRSGVEFASPFPLRLSIEAAPAGTRVRLLKRRGPPCAAPILIQEYLQGNRHVVAGPALAQIGAGRALAFTQSV